MSEPRSGEEFPNGIKIGISNQRPCISALVVILAKYATIFLGCEVERIDAAED
jgi:hypothetical protein